MSMQAPSSRSRGTTDRPSTDADRADRSGLDELFEVLAHRHRRYLLYYLRANGSARGHQLVDVVAVATGQEDDPAARQRIADRLKEEHLPRMVEADLVRVDVEANTVHLAFVPQYVYEWLDRARTAERSESEGSP
jgi:hypothetical protein